MPTAAGFHLGGRRSRPDGRDHSFIRHPAAAAMARAPVRPKVDLRPTLPPAWDQSSLGSCEAHGCTRAALPYWLAAVEFMPSRLAAYAWAREKGGTPLSSDAGCYTRDMLKVLQDGIYDEKVWAYDVAQFNVAPPADIERPFKISGYTQINSLDEFTACLNGNGLIAFAMALPDYFDDVNTSGVVKPYNGEDIVGEHCMCAVGYDITGRVPMAIVCNSWGEEWGEAGHCYVPISMILDRHIGDDAWAVYDSTNM